MLDSPRYLESSPWIVTHARAFDARLFSPGDFGFPVGDDREVSDADAGDAILKKKINEGQGQKAIQSWLSVKSTFLLRILSPPRPPPRPLGAVFYTFIFSTPSVTSSSASLVLLSSTASPLLFPSHFLLIAF